MPPYMPRQRLRSIHKTKLQGLGFSSSQSLQSQMPPHPKNRLPLNRLQACSRTTRERQHYLRWVQHPRDEPARADVPARPPHCLCTTERCRLVQPGSPAPGTGDRDFANIPGHVGGRSLKPRRFRYFASSRCPIRMKSASGTKSQAASCRDCSPPWRSLQIRSLSSSTSRPRRWT